MLLQWQHGSTIGTFDSCPIFFPGVQRGWGREVWQLAMSQVSDGVTVYLICIYFICNMFFVTHVMNKRNRVAFDTAPQSWFVWDSRMKKQSVKLILQLQSSWSIHKKTIQNCQWNQAFQQANYLACNAKYSQASKGCRFGGVQQHDQRLFSPKMKWLEN